MIPAYNYLIVSILTPNKTDVISEISRIAVSCGCNILNIEFNRLGTEQTIILYLAGNWGAIAKMEAALPALEQRLGLSTLVQRTSEPPSTEPSMTYSLQLAAIDKMGILNGISDFLYKMNIPIDQISAHTYLSQSGTRMVSMNLKLKVSDKVHLASLREKLIGYCDDNNLDAYIEPTR